MIFFHRLTSVRVCLLIVSIHFLLACSGGFSLIPVSDKSQGVYHTVVPGDTLFSIAWRNDMDYLTLAKVNGLEKPYIIKPGQRIYLTGKAAGFSTSNTRPSAVKTTTASSPAPAEEIITSNINATQNASNISWQWPTTGKVTKRFAAESGLSKGIDLSGKLGQPVVASASGTVVYAGSGLLGYGQLVILKHNETFLSAYAHNSKLLVKEGDKVVRGQQIADMGSSGTNRVKLHFEIRKEGKPVDPLIYLPAK